MCNILDKERIELDVRETGHRIKTLMKLKNVQVKDICKALDVSFQAVYRWQKGETLPTIRNLFILGQMLETDVDDMLVSKQMERGKL